MFFFPKIMTGASFKKQYVVVKETQQEEPSWEEPQLPLRRNK
jgi:hypothetical protein